jgi:uncharacterized membrane protein YgcG
MAPTTPEDSLLTPSARGLRYAVAIVIVVIGILCGAIIPGTLGGTICTAVVGIGLVAVVSLVFYDVGLSEDRDRARQEKRMERLKLDDSRRRNGQAAHRGDGHAGEGRSGGGRPGSGRSWPRQGRIRDEHGRLN